jgi:hypothetical protein
MSVVPINTKRDHAHSLARWLRRQLRSAGVRSVSVRVMGHRPARGAVFYTIEIVPNFRARPLALGVPRPLPELRVPRRPGSRGGKGRRKH